MVPIFNTMVPAFNTMVFIFNTMVLIFNTILAQLKVVSRNEGIRINQLAGICCFTMEE